MLYEAVAHLGPYFVHRAAGPLRQTCPGAIVGKAHLRLDQHQVDEQHDVVMLNVFIGEALAIWTLCQSDTFAERPIIGFAVGCVEVWYGVRAGDAERHLRCIWRRK